MPVLYLSLQQVIGSRCMGDWLGYKSPDQTADGRALDWSFGLGRWYLDRNWICVYWLDCGLSSSSFALYYHLTDFTLHLLFLFTTLTFSTRFPIINRYIYICNQIGR